METYQGLDKRNLYRLPWSMNDNPIAWLEITDICNLSCEGCYRQTITRHKTLEQIKEEILFFKRWRNPDNFSIAGGEPLIHPQICDIVHFIAENGMKPVILTNAQALTPEFLKELKKAGLAGFTFHIDSHQNRPHWRDKDEKEHNELRQKYAEMCASEGGLYVIFNSTVYPSTFHEVPDVVRWGIEHMDIVNGLVFITYRTIESEKNVGVTSSSEMVDLARLSFSRDHFEEKFITSPDVWQLIRENFPEYDAASYLGGTIRHDSFKWLIGALVGDGNKVYGAVGKQTMEIAQVGHHLLYKNYLAYLSQANIGKKLFLASPWDKTLRKAAQNWFKDVARNPLRLFKPVRIMSIGIIQAPDALPDGRADMCDSCPDITYYDGKLVNSCRMDEYRLFGNMLVMVSKDNAATTQPAPQDTE